MKLLKNQSGFSMVEVLVAAGMMGVIAYTFMHMSEQVTLMESRMKDLMDLNDIESRIRIHMADANSCFSTFQPAFKELKTNDKLHFPVTLKQISGRYGSPLLEVGKKYGRFEVLSIKADFIKTSIPKKNFENEIGFINIYYELKSHTKKSMVKKGRVSQSAIISHPSTSNKGPFMVSCFSDRSIMIEEIADAVMERTCSTFGVPYNSSTRNCDMSSLLNGMGGISGGKANFPTSSPSATPASIPASSNTDQPLDVKKMQDMQQKAMEMMQQFIKDSGGFDALEED